uniref:Fatty acyl-CoA reductase C-terminal domain-containing protein n=1 Tax=Timema douglasi TaxID=61478 RepID=A0A7R8ZH23_TIMDO|nr:unnamed protein product [Timema douglasi]
MCSRPKEVPVYNLTASAVKKMTWKEVLDIGRKIIYDYPFEMTVWYPDGNIRASKFMHNMCVIFLHFLPAYLIDFLMLIFFQKPFMVHIHKRIQNGLLLLQYFTTRRWVFHSSKFLALGEDGNQVDKDLFSIDFSQVIEEQYLKDCLLGGRQYCMKEPLSSLPRCRRILKV